jgi:Mrp family chromosome partitioning ATPase
VPLTVFQSLPVHAAVVVTTPQDLVSLIVEKAVRMAKTMKIPVKGIVENMSGFTCPDCGKTHAVFGEGKLDELAIRHGIEATASLPIDPKISAAVDEGRVESVEGFDLELVLDALFGPSGR